VPSGALLPLSWRDARPFPDGLVRRIAHKRRPERLKVVIGRGSVRSGMPEQRQEVKDGCAPRASLARSRVQPECVVTLQASPEPGTVPRDHPDQHLVDHLASPVAAERRCRRQDDIRSRRVRRPWAGQSRRSRRYTDTTSRMMPVIGPDDGSVLV
jgi:hypothetical protein